MYYFLHCININYTDNSRNIMLLSL